MKTSPSSTWRLAATFCLMLSTMLLLDSVAQSAAAAPNSGGLIAQIIPGPAQGAGGGGVRWTWPLKTVVLVLLFIATTAFCFFTFFQSMVRNGWWPLDGYGRTWALVIVITTVFALTPLFFWNDMVIQPRSGAVKWHHVWGIRLAVIASAALLCWLSISLFHSERRRKAGQSKSN